MNVVDRLRLKDLVMLVRDRAGLVGAGTLILSLLILGAVRPGIFAPQSVSNTAFTCPTGESPLAGAEQHILPAGDSTGRPGPCFKPSKIVIHTTTGNFPTMQSVYDYFASGSAGNGVSSHFLVGTNGEVWQLLKTFSGAAEEGASVHGYNLEAVSIEILYPGDFANKAAVPPAQYNAVLALTKQLMDQYQITLGTNDCNWISPTGEHTDAAGSGIFGHYQLNPYDPNKKTDPGKGMQCDLMADLALTGTAVNPNAPGTTTDSTGNTTGVGGAVSRRFTAYDGYARPFSWPISGKVKQVYGFTEEAQSLGQRFGTAMYPFGDPDVVFSKSNNKDVGPNPDAKKNRYLNPNIDVEPSNTSASARAVFATHAGWLTYADWAGPEKGYSVQIESDVDGDGQADLATRYMRLQGPRDYNGVLGFAPDIPVKPQPKESLPVAQAPVVIEGESMSSNSSFAVPVPIGGASNGFAMGMYKGATISKTVTARADRLTVIAKGDQCLGAPIMVLRKDDSILQRVEVNTSDWAEYTYEVAFDGTAHVYSIEFENDAIGPGCDRNLYIDTSSFVVTNPNAPVTKTLSSTRIEAESLSATGNNAPTKIADDQASNKGIVGFFYPGKVSGDLSATDPNWMIVRARGDQCGTEAPTMVVHLDSSAYTFEVPDKDWTDYAISVTLSAGQASGKHTLSIDYTNDTQRKFPDPPPWCDRNLYVDYVDLQKNETTQSTTNKESLIGKTKYVAFNQLIGYVSASRSSDHPSSVTDTQIPNANQTYLSYRIMYNNPNITTFPTPNEPDSFINARVDNPYIIETPNNTVAGSLKTIFNDPFAPMYFFCAQRNTGDNVKCVDYPNP